MHEFQVTLSLPSEAQDIKSAVEEFRWDVANGPGYVYEVDTGEGVFRYDAENGAVTPVEKIDKGKLDSLAERVFDIAHELDPDEPSDIHRSQYDEELTAKIRQELYKLFGLV